MPIQDEQLGAAMLYSSGTTGQAEGDNPTAARDVAPGREPAAVSMVCGPSGGSVQDMVYLSPAPLYHSAPHASVALASRLGATTIVMEHFDAARYLELVGRYRGHALPGRADNVLPPAEAAGRGPEGRRRLVARSDHPRGSAVPGRRSKSR